MKLDRFVMPLGMIGVLSYFIHTVMGNLIWTEYNAITMEISCLTDVASPDGSLLRLFTNIYSISMILFIANMVRQSIKQKNNLLKWGFLLLFCMFILSTFTYNIMPVIPLFRGAELHLLNHITAFIMMMTMVGTTYTIALGYIRVGAKVMGKVILIIALFITAFSMFYVIGMTLQWHVVGLSERLIMYTHQIMIFALSFKYTNHAYGG